MERLSLPLLLLPIDSSRASCLLRLLLPWGGESGNLGKEVGAQKALGEILKLHEVPMFSCFTMLYQAHIIEKLIPVVMLFAEGGGGT